jgi:hypothetical protein
MGEESKEADKAKEENFFRKQWPALTAFVVPIAVALAWFNGVLDISGKIESMRGKGNPELVVDDVSLTPLKCNFYTSCSIDPDTNEYQFRPFQLTFSVHKKYGVLLSGCYLRVECHSACNIDPLSRGIGVQNWL